MAEHWNGPLERIDAWRVQIPKDHVRGMRVPGIIYANEALMPLLAQDQAPQQVVNVAHLPGIVGASIAMPDIHWGYGFPIGGVAAMDEENGVISPGGVGYDINCGVRVVRTNLSLADIKDQIKTLVDTLFQNIPSGVGSTGKVKLSKAEQKNVLRDGSAWAVEHGFGWAEDLEFTEAGGKIEEADPDRLSKRALERGREQLGTLGSGNHFIEIQEVTEIFDPTAAKAFGLEKGQITIMIHTGSRGLGYQVCDDHLDVMVRAMQKYKIRVPDPQLSCAPVRSPEGEQYLSAMAAAANYAWANRQVILHWVRESFATVLDTPSDKLQMHMIYDVAHNIAKREIHTVDGKDASLVVHRKGATRAFGPGHSDVPKQYQKVGQPVLIPGDMGTASYILAGTQKAMDETFGSTCHGAGRVMSRHAAIRATKGRALARELEDKGIHVRSRGKRTLAEETPEAYKDIHQVVNVVDSAGIASKVARMRPLGVIKG
ncbi:RtcB family protein [candidate division KSB1 bacterium]|nr:RtcB family protein [candidate division KSB1 bacterium]